MIIFTIDVMLKNIHFYRLFNLNLKNFINMVYEISEKISSDDLFKHKSGFKRSKALVGMTEYLSKILQKQKIKRWLECEWNWFLKKSCNILWHGVYHCYSCKIKFNTKVEKLGENNLYLFINWNDQVSHINYVKKKQE
jgi:hypothetical protein